MSNSICRLGVRALMTLAIVATAEHAAFGVTLYGGVFDDGALHIVSANLIAHDPGSLPGGGETGALVRNGSSLRMLGTGLIDVTSNTGGGVATGIQVLIPAAQKSLRAGELISLLIVSMGTA